LPSVHGISERDPNVWRGEQVIAGMVAVNDDMRERIMTSHMTDDAKYAEIDGKYTEMEEKKH
jgi:hypothetical protein